MKRIKPRIALVIFLLSGSAGVFLAGGEDVSIARGYYAQAAQYLTARNTAQAEKLLKTACEFMPEFADAWYLLAGIALQDDKNIMQGLGLLEKAVALPGWQYNDPVQAGKELSNLYYRIKQYSKAESLLAGLYAGSGTDADIAILYAKTLRYLGKTTAMNTVVNAALKQYPTAEELYILSAEQSYAAKQSTTALQTIAAARHTLPGSPELLYFATKYTADPAARLDLVKRYMEAAGRRPEIVLLGLEQDKENAKMYLEYFVKMGGNRDITHVRSLLDKLAAESDQELLTYYRTLDSGAIEKSKTLERFLDLNGDTYFEETYTYMAAGLARIAMDNDQNGQAEWLIDFSGPQPSAVQQLKNGQYISYVYSIYPHLTSVHYPGKESDSLYTLVPFTSTLPLLRSMEEYHYTLDPRLGGLSEAQAKTAAYRQDFFRPGNLTAYKAADWLNGVLTGEKSDTDEDGTFDYFIEYKAGQAIKAYRDFDNDGVREAVEYYKSGKPERIEFDENNDKIPDSVQYYDTPPGTSVTYWDYNFDGKYDARQQLRKGTCVLEFAVAYDGVFDLRVEFTNNKITSIKRGKSLIPVQPDAQPHVYWIGKRGNNLPGITNLASGQYATGGKAYFIFRHSDDVYIEELK